MKTKQAKRPLKQQDIELIDKLIDRFNQLLSWTLGFGVLGITDEKIVEELGIRLKRLRRNGKESSPTNLQEDYELNKKFFRELHNLLIEFHARKGLGTEYDKRKTLRFAETALGYEKVASE